MNANLSLILETLEETADRLLFRLMLCNNSDVKLLLSYPEIHGLRFVNKATMKESEWYTSLLVSAFWKGVALDSGEEKAIEYHVRPCAVDGPAEDDGTDYCRWCVDLPNGEYLVWFELEVGEDYFRPDSYCGFVDLRREAEAIQAVVWTGQARSNRLHLLRT